MMEPCRAALRLDRVGGSVAGVLRPPQLPANQPADLFQNETVRGTASTRWTTLKDTLLDQFLNVASSGIL